MGLIATVTEDLAGKHINAIRKILDADVFEEQMGAMLRDYVMTYLNFDPELYCEVFDRLAKEKVISKLNFRELLRK